MALARRQILSLLCLPIPPPERDSIIAIVRLTAQCPRGPTTTRAAHRRASSGASGTSAPHEGAASRRSAAALRTASAELLHAAAHLLLDVEVAGTLHGREEGRELLLLALQEIETSALHADRAVDELSDPLLVGAVTVRELIADRDSHVPLLANERP